VEFLKEKASSQSYSNIEGGMADNTEYHDTSREQYLHPPGPSLAKTITFLNNIS
jgi:hypothetical protein